MLAKVAEWLKAGVVAVVVLDPGPNTAHVFGADDPPRMLRSEEEWTLPGLWEGSCVRVGWFFE